MYYNNKFKIANISISIAGVTTAIILLINKIDIKVILPVILAGGTIQNLTLSLNSFKLKKKRESMVRFAVGIFLFIVASEYIFV